MVGVHVTLLSPDSPYGQSAWHGQPLFLQRSAMPPATLPNFVLIGTLRITPQPSGFHVESGCEWGGFCDIIIKRM